MLQQLNRINKEEFVSEIVTKDYRTAVTFWKYGIDFCCGGRLPLEKACAARGLDTEIVRDDLENTIRHTPIYNTLKFREWDLDFLMDYIIRVHHEYLKTILPLLNISVQEFVERHQEKYRYLPELESIFVKLVREILPHLSQEEEVTFPYIRQMEYAYNNKEAYAGLLVRTLSKPVEEVIRHNHELMEKYLSRIREITSHYTPPPNACITHKVNYSMLRELDNDLLQHLHLENDILLPKAIAIENELLHQIS